MAHEPSRLEWHAENTVELMAADAFLRRSEEMQRLEPLGHRYVAVLKDRPDLDRELLAAGSALSEANARARARQRVSAVDHATVGADRTIRPQESFDMP